MTKYTETKIAPHIVVPRPALDKLNKIIPTNFETAEQKRKLHQAMRNSKGWL